MSIKLIAEKAGVSPSTVSRVLNNPNYKPNKTELRDKIWKIAMEINYVPNEAARNLRSGISKSREKVLHINVLMTRSDSAQTDPFFLELLHVIESEIHRQVCVLSKVWHKPIFSNDRRCRSENLEKVIREMYEQMERPGDGLLVIGKCNREALKLLKKYFRHVVSVNRNSTNYEVDEILCDGSKIARLAVEYLISLGHKHIGYIGTCRGESRYKGYLETLEKHGLEFDNEYVVETKQTEVEGYDAMKMFFQMSDAPTAIYCANDITAIGVLKCLNTFKNRIYSPSIISSDDILEAQNTHPMLTTVQLPKEEMGSLAIKLLLDRIRGEHTSVVRLEVEGNLIIRQSCTPVEDSRWCEYYI